MTFACNFIYDDPNFNFGHCFGHVPISLLPGEGTAAHMVVPGTEKALTKLRSAPVYSNIDKNFDHSAAQRGTALRGSFCARSVIPKSHNLLW